MDEQRASVRLGIGDESVRVGDHVAYFWESSQEFEAGVGFLALGLRGADHGVIFGHGEANGRVLEVLRRQGVDTDGLLREGRLAVVGGDPSCEAMLSAIGGAFQRMVDAGAPLIRLLGNIGWGREGWPCDEDILAFEAQVTAAARQFPCVVVCLYDLGALSGRIVVHGAFETHPLTFCRNLLRENPYHVPLEQFLARPQVR